MIRGNTIKYSSFKKKQQQQQEIKLEQEIKILEDEANANFLNMTEKNLNDLENKKSSLNEIQKEKIWGGGNVTIKKQIRRFGRKTYTLLF